MKGALVSLIKPVKGSYFVKSLHPSFYKAAISLDGYSCENFWDEKVISDLMKNPRIDGWIMANAINPVAYVVFEKIKKQPIVQILNLVVHPDHRRAGIASIFVKKIISRFTNSCDSVTINVRDSNLSAHLFLQNLGFVAEKVEKGYFEDHWGQEIDIEDAYCFRKNIRD